MSEEPDWTGATSGRTGERENEPSPGRPAATVREHGGNGFGHAGGLVSGSAGEPVSVAVGQVF
jgi:hypothetical protein